MMLPQHADQSCGVGGWGCCGGGELVSSSSSWSSRLLADSARPKDLKELVLSVAQHHLKTIELFGAIIGFLIGVGQAIYFWFTYHPR